MLVRIIPKGSLQWSVLENRKKLFQLSFYNYVELFEVGIFVAKNMPKSCFFCQDGQSKQLAQDLPFACFPPRNCTEWKRKQKSC